jgi:hypothetical protein
LGDFASTAISVFWFVKKRKEVSHHPQPSRSIKIPLASPSSTTTTMIVENNINQQKRLKIGSSLGPARKSLLLPSDIHTSGSGGKNSFQSLVSKSPSDPALVKNDSVQAIEDKSLPPPSSPKKSVRFDEVIFRNLVHSQEEVDPTEIWYSSQDFQRGAKEIQVLVQQVWKRQQELLKSGIKIQRTNGSPPHPELRGVEDLASPHSFRCRKMRMNQVIKGVLQEQKRQISLGQRNPLLLSVRCREVSTISQQLAIQRARWDAKEAASASGSMQVS